MNRLMPSACLLTSLLGTLILRFVLPDPEITATPWKLLALVLVPLGV